MNTASLPLAPSASTVSSCLVDVEGRVLPLVATSLTARACGGVARVVLEQRFHNPYDVPLTVTYSLPLPPDAAVSGFEFEVGRRTIVGEIDKRAMARERFEQAMLEGKTAALLDQDRSALFTQEIGNLAAGADLVARITIDQRLRWLDDAGATGEWEWRFPTTVGPRYLGSPGRVQDAARVVQDVASGPLPVTMALALEVLDALAEGRRLQSPSHSLRLESEGRRATFAEESVALDRDVVVRWSVAGRDVGASIAVARPHEGHDAYALVTLVPPAADAHAATVPRDLLVLIDTSGSMSGEPLAHARRVVGALVDTLSDRDQLELIEFGSFQRRWNSSPVLATAKERKSAHAWLASLRASGSTEMRSAIVEGMATLRAECQRQVVLVTDGQIGFESEVVAEILARLPKTARVHTVGVGSAVNRTLTAGGARAGRGVEVVVGLGEDPERAAHRIVARTRAPVVVDLELSGSALLEHAPRRLPDLFAGAPALLSARVRAAGGELVVSGRTARGSWTARVAVPATRAGEGDAGITALFAREAVEDREMDLAAGEPARTIDAAIEALGLSFHIATRMTSWVAVALEPSVDPQSPTRRVRMPHELPHGMSAEGLGLRACALPAPPSSMAFGGAMPQAPLRAALPAEAPVPSRPRAPGIVSRIKEAFSKKGGDDAEDVHELVTRSTSTSLTRIVRGRSIVGSDGTQGIEGLVEGIGLDWVVPSEVEVVWDDGTRTTEAVDADRSTRSGIVQPSESLRVVLLGSSARRPLAVVIHVGGDRVVLAV